jgi:hypothetical protein
MAIENRPSGRSLNLAVAMMALAAMGGEVPIKYHRSNEHKPNPHPRAGWHPKKARNLKGKRR